MTSPSDRVSVIVAAARAAGAGLLSDFARLDSLRVQEKRASDFVSSADLASEAMLREALSKAFPSYGLVMEESAPALVAATGPRFFVDPLDGTTNFLHGIPHFAVSIGLEDAGEMVAGVVLDVPKNEVFWAERGVGAFLDDARLAPRPGRPLAASVVATGIPHRGGRDHAGYLLALERVMREVAGIRRFGAAALDLAYVAAGRVDAFFEKGLAPWDVAAGGLLVREVGGVVSRSDGSAMGLGDGDLLAASSAATHAALLPLLSRER